MKTCRFAVTAMVAVAQIVFVSGVAQGVSIGLNAVGPSDSDWDHDGIEVHVTQFAGVVLQNHWNNLFNPPNQHEVATFDRYKNRSGSLANLWDSNNTLTGASAQWNTPFETWDTGIPRLSGNHQLMHGYLDADEYQAVTITLQNLPSAFLSGYDVYVYHESQSHWGEGRVGRVTIADQTMYARDMVGTFNGTFYEDGYATLADAQTGSGGNYLVFRGLTEPSLSLYAIAVWSPPNEPFKRMAVQGIQIVASPVPEPATAVLLAAAGLAGCAMAAMRRRRR